MAGSEAPYELIYWPGLPGRGEFIRLLFEETKTPFTDTAQELDPGAAAQKVLGIVSPDAVGPNNPPVLACPVLRHGDLVLHQTPNILQYLAVTLGLAPTEGNAIYHLNQIVMTLSDGFVSEVHDTHHPTSVSLTYEEQKPEAKLRARHFVNERLPKFFAYAQQVIKAKTSGDGPWMYGGQFTYADLFLFQAVDGTQYAFPKTTEKLKKTGEYDAVFELYEAVKERPNIKAYLASERRQPYASGIYRHYPELEE